MTISTAAADACSSGSVCSIVAPIRSVCCVVFLDARFSSALALGSPLTTAKGCGMVNRRIACLTICATTLAAIPPVGNFHGNSWLLFSPIIIGPGSMWLYYRAHKLAPEVKFLRWYPMALAPFAFNLIGIGIALWQVAAGHVGAL